MMGRKYLQKHNLMESHKHFMRLINEPINNPINEGYLSSVIGEDDDPQDPNAQGGAPADPMGGQDPMGGGMGAPADPMAGGADAQGGADPMGGADGGADPMADGDPMGGAEGPMDMDMDEPDLDGGNPEDLEDDNTVIDVEDIVQAQEKLNKKENEIGKDVSSLGSDYTKLLAALEKMQKTIDAQDQRMSQLSNELEKRIPTQQERLQMQSLKSYPFNIDPNEYWNEKEKDGDYKASDEPRDNKPLEIKQKMIDNYNASEIEDSFENPSTKDIFKGFY